MKHAIIIVVTVYEWFASKLNAAPTNGVEQNNNNKIANKRRVSEPY